MRTWAWAWAQPSLQVNGCVSTKFANPSAYQLGQLLSLIKRIPIDVRPVCPPDTIPLTEDDLIANPIMLNLRAFGVVEFHPIALNVDPQDLTATFDMHAYV